MAGDASSIDRQKVSEQACADGGGALGVELRTVEIVPLHTGAEGRAVAGARDRRGANLERVTVHEVCVVAIGKTRQQRTGTPYIEGIPAHVRYRPILGRRDTRGAARNDS